MSLAAVILRLLVICISGLTYAASRAAWPPCNFSFTRRWLQVSEAEVDKKGDGYVLKSDPSVRVHARAHKMSKSRGNVINPDDVVQEFGGDSLRLYEMFMGPLRDTKVGGFLVVIAW
jgi:hypothetical protein